MDFQRYNDGVGLIAQNKFQSAVPECPLCGERVDWEIAFDFSGNLICILAKCPHCGGVVKTIFDFTNEPISTFSVSQIGTQNVSNLTEKTKYYIASYNPSSQFFANDTRNNNGYTAPNNYNTQNNAPKEDSSDSVGWGFLGFFIPLAGFILWLVWKNDYPKRSRAAGIGCLVSIILGVVAALFWYVVFINLLSDLATAPAVILQAVGLLNLLH